MRGSGADRYVLGRQIGEGGMAFVFEALDRETDEMVAVKRMRLAGSRDTTRVARFQREITVSSLLDHPHCVRVLDRGKDADGVPYFVMPRLRGVSLADCFLRPTPPGQVVRLGLQLLDALTHVHALGVAHRDVKPENIFLVGGPGEVETTVLIDFGLAKFITQAEETSGLVTIPGTVMGTPGAMSPEQILAEEVDHRADLYGVGIVMYTLLAGKRPFDGDDAELERILRQQVQGDYPRLPQSLHESLRRFVDDLLTPNPESRPLSAEAARSALQQVESQCFSDTSTWHDLFAPAARPGPHARPQTTAISPTPQV